MRDEVGRAGHFPSGRSWAVGVGFRKACSSETLVALVRRALAQAEPAHPIVLVTIAEKDRPVLREAAAALRLPVVVLPKAALRRTDERITIVSDAAKACFGLPSVAEAAALAAAGPGSRLIVTRISVPDATCAIAAPSELAPAAAAPEEPAPREPAPKEPAPKEPA